MANTLIPMKKRCGKCRKTKSDEEFPLRGWRKPGQRSSQCKSCSKKITRAHEAAAVADAIQRRAWDGWQSVDKETYLRAFKSRHGFKRRYGITLENYLDLVDEQGNQCRICAAQPDTKNLAVDHCHSTGRVRGLLCSNCNMGIGYFGDDPNRIRRAARYVENSRF